MRPDVPMPGETIIENVNGVGRSSSQKTTISNFAMKHATRATITKHKPSGVGSTGGNGNGKNLQRQDWETGNLLWA